MISFTPGYFGWLGNQMFQYAATCALALHRGVPWAFPKNRPDLHAIFNLSAVVTPERRSRYDEPHFHHDPAFWNLPDGTELSGYFQSEKYFAPYADEIRREFAFSAQSEVGDMIQNLVDITREEPGTVSIHVRRGDYLSFPEHHPPLTMDYYREAMSRFPDARFLVFSDDPGWCLLNFRDAGYDVEISTGRSAAEDMALMAACDHHIIANSSFSWWGAWLGRNPEKRVIAPAAWFGPAKQPPQWDTRDLLPEAWKRI